MRDKHEGSAGGVIFCKCDAAAYGDTASARPRPCSFPVFGCLAVYYFVCPAQLDVGTLACKLLSISRSCKTVDLWGPTLSTGRATSACTPKKMLMIRIGRLGISVAFVYLHMHVAAQISVSLPLKADGEEGVVICMRGASLPRLWTFYSK